MREAALWLFSENHSDMQITLFSGWHIFYLVLTFGMALGLSLAFRNRSAQAKKRVLDLFALLTVGLYVADFFIMPLSDSYTGISEYKLPFNICTAMAVLVPFVQFNPRFRKIKTTVVFMGMAGALMWMCYPGTALGGQPPFCYIIIQTFVYHSFLFCYGVFAISLGDVKPDIKQCWKELVGVLLMLVWAWFGNSVYEGNNWFFIQESIFPFLSDEIMPIAVVVSVFGVILCLYGCYYLIRSLGRKKLAV